MPLKDEYEGWKVVSFADDGSVLIESPLGNVRRVKVIGTVEMRKEINELKRQLIEQSEEVQTKWASPAEVAVMKRRIAELEELTSKLKKTKDGVVVVPNQPTSLWYIHPSSGIVYERKYEADLEDAHSHYNKQNKVEWISVRDCYYFRENAVAEALKGDSP